AKGRGGGASLNALGRPHRTGHPALPRRKPLPHVKVLGARPAKPRRPPAVELEKFGAAARPGKPAVEPPRSTQPGMARQLQVPQRRMLLVQEGKSPRKTPHLGDEDEIYDDVESVGLLRTDQGFLLPPVSRPPAYPHPRGG
ncbi:hypothetical protein M959_11096, partial [Chaetura pelagica]